MAQGYFFSENNSKTLKGTYNFKAAYISQERQNNMNGKSLSLFAIAAILIGVGASVSAPKAMASITTSKRKSG